VAQAEVQTTPETIHQVQVQVAVVDGVPQVAQASLLERRATRLAAQVVKRLI
jgi:hypothetical protein